MVLSLLIFDTRSKGDANVTLSQITAKYFFGNYFPRLMENKLHFSIIKGCLLPTANDNLFISNTWCLTLFDYVHACTEQK